MLPIFPRAKASVTPMAKCSPKLFDKIFTPFLTAPESTLGEKIGAIRQCIGYNYSKTWNYLYTNARARIPEETPYQKHPRQRR